MNVQQTILLFVEKKGRDEWVISTIIDQKLVSGSQEKKRETLSTSGSAGEIQGCTPHYRGVRGE
jgi:hypothetical protein